MKTQILKRVMMLLVIVLSISCSKDDDVPVVNPGVTLIEKEGEWSCNLSETCQDIYKFQFKAGSRISISIEEVTGSSVVSLDVYVDFGEIGGPNLLTNGGITHYGCTGQNEEVSLGNILLPEDETYNIAVARDWGLSAGFDGTYKLTVISDTPFLEGEVMDDAAASDYERECI
ncbi:PPC domain-containing protein [Aquimarina sp. 2201CG14-23]|uniref:PPC domain-containing protein n=1 Tax=Aquimarina mycalae TaxID=3040073 RepID=UPI002477DF66|nr:PPC domain-containing protein [Aquimarina sp. 2201CG14-23]MDH7446269.1 PPC domain-containing protein [Aquimarina sp. 2201CG14-23]